ncbi:hypothetical protein [Oceanobacillus sojae]|uniref:Uncharacterized protein n=1 Tax=Oceanobacillus sojae TaxID=582851 RepID=A0A511ZIH7_9BACI|nr:hypothetical protein [Oceanobacillus sojae]GEN87253.1 hypothetical protein OSO01_19920 [Oceanobacillus sojae]
MSEVQIDIQRTGFPVKIGEIELWFDSSYENLVNFSKVADKAQKEAEKNIEEIKNIDIPDDYLEAAKDLPGMHEQGLKIVEFKKKQTAIEYDFMFGKGTFTKLYKKYPDYVALQNGLKALRIAIIEKIAEQAEEQDKEDDAVTEEFIRNKAKQIAKKK